MLVNDDDDVNDHMLIMEMSPSKIQATNAIVYKLSTLQLITNRSLHEFVDVKILEG